MDPTTNFHYLEKQPKVENLSASYFPKYANTPTTHSLYHSHFISSSPPITKIPLDEISRTPLNSRGFSSQSFTGSPKIQFVSDFSPHTAPIRSFNQNSPNTIILQPQSVLSTENDPKGFRFSEFSLDMLPESNSGYTSLASSAPDRRNLFSSQHLTPSSVSNSYLMDAKSNNFADIRENEYFDTPISTTTARDEKEAKPSYFEINKNFPKSPQVSLLKGLITPKTPQTVHLNFPETLYKKNVLNRRKEAFTNPKILNCLVQFLECNEILNFKNLYFEYRHSIEPSNTFKKRLEQIIFNIKTKEDQYKFWNSIVDFKRVRNDHPFAFTQHFVKKCEYIRDITKDLDRTFPEYPMFSTGKVKDSLLKVLVAISTTVKEVGYIQGLNSIAGVFLFYLKEEESFWMLLYLMEKLKMKEFFKHDFERISILNYQLETFVNYYLPSISQLFVINLIGPLNLYYKEDQPISLSNITTQWFITLFSYYLKIPNVAKVWNLMFIYGISFLIQFSLAILSKYKSYLF